MNHEKSNKRTKAEICSRNRRKTTEKKTASQEVMTKATRIIYGLSIFGWIACFVLWRHFGMWVYEYGTSIVIFGATLTNLIAAKNLRDHHWIWIFGFFVACNNLMDELFFDPEEYSWNEYIMATITLSVLIYRYFHNKKQIT